MTKYVVEMHVEYVVAMDAKTDLEEKHHAVLASFRKQTYVELEVKKPLAI